MPSFFLNNQMTKSIKELKKENQFLKSKSEKSDITLIELVDEVNDFFFLSFVCFLDCTIQPQGQLLASPSSTCPPK